MSQSEDMTDQTPDSAGREGETRDASEPASGAAGYVSPTPSPEEPPSQPHAATAPGPPRYPQGYSWPQGVPGYESVAYPPAQARRSALTFNGRVIAAVAALAVLAGLVGGGIGGYVGYRFGYHAGDSGTGSLEQAPPARSTSAASAGSVTQVAQKVLPSVVQLQVQGVQGAAEGSGIVLSRDGYLLTNNHVIQGALPGRITAQFHDGRIAPVTVVGADPNSDLAVVRASIDGLTPAELGRSDDLPIGAAVVAIGSPFGLSETVTSGIISAKDRPVRAGGENGSQASVLNALQTDAAINPGNSGGPLVDLDGRVVGVNSAIYSPGSGADQTGSVGLGFAIPIDQVRRTALELKNTGSATDATLGVQVTGAGVPGALVGQVIPGGAAYQAGIRAGELITRLDARSIRDPDSLVAAVRSHAPGDRVTVTLVRPGGADVRTLQVTLGGQKS